MFPDFEEGRDELREERELAGMKVSFILEDMTLYAVAVAVEVWLRARFQSHTLQRRITTTENQMGLCKPQLVAGMEQFPDENQMSSLNAKIQVSSPAL